MRVMVPPGKMGVVGVNFTVTGTDDLYMMRSDEAIVRDKDNTRVGVYMSTVLK